MGEEPVPDPRVNGSMRIPIILLALASSGCLSTGTMPLTETKAVEAETVMKHRQNLLRQPTPVSRMEIGPSGKPAMATIHP